MLRALTCASEIVGDVRGRVPVIVDDMISTAGTIHAAAKALLATGCGPSVVVTATDGLFGGPALERPGALPLTRRMVADTLSTPPTSALPIQVVRIASPVAEAICGLQSGKPDDKRAIDG